MKNLTGSLFQVMAELTKRTIEGCTDWMKLREELKKILSIVFTLTGLMILFFISYCGRIRTDEDSGYLYVSEITTSNGYYTGSGNIIKYALSDMKRIDSQEVLINTLDINTDFTSLVGIVKEKGTYRIEEIDLKTYKKESLFSCEKIKGELTKNGIEKSDEEIRKVKFMNDEDEYSFIYEKILWKATDKGLEPLVEMNGNCYEWMGDNEILIEQDGQIVIYSLEEKKCIKAFPECELEGGFAVSNDKKTMVYEGKNKHGLYKYSFETGEIEYLSSLSGTAEIAFSKDNNFIVYCDRYFTFTHSGATKLYIMDLASKRKKIIKNYHGNIVGGIVCG